MKKRIVYTAFFLILLIALRFAFLDIRPLHHDEGVNYFFAEKILTEGIFHYDPLNYHGPLYFFLLAFSFFLFGISVFSLRLPAILAGIALSLSPFFFKCKKSSALLASAFLFLSPSLFYYSRYSIHETLFVFLTLLYLFSLIKILEDRNLNYLPLFTASLALLLATKETVVISIIFTVILLAVYNKKITKISFAKERETLIYSILLFVLIYILLFTGFFTNMQGLADSIKGYFPWTDRGIHEPGHQKPLWYYILLLLGYELPLVAFGTIAGIAAFRSKKDIFHKIFFLWFLFSFIAYSAIPYKTPWLIISMTAPLCFLAAKGINLIHKKTLRVATILISILYLGFFSWYLNFYEPWQPGNPFAYVHTSPDIERLVSEIQHQYTPTSKILIFSDTYWPLPFYIDNKETMYLSDTSSFTYNSYKDYDIFILNNAQLADFPPNQNANIQKFYLRPDFPLYLVTSK